MYLGLGGSVGLNSIDGIFLTLYSHGPEQCRKVLTRRLENGRNKVNSERRLKRLGHNGLLRRSQYGVYSICSLYGRILPTSSHNGQYEITVNIRSGSSRPIKVPSLVYHLSILVA